MLAAMEQRASCRGALWAGAASMALATIVALPVLAQEATGEPTPTATSSQASSDAGPEATAEPLMIGIRVIEPFVVADGDGWGGFSIDLWDEVADRAELEFEYVELETVGEQVAAVEAGDVDAATAAISITTERERTIDFSHSFYDAGLQVMVRDGLTGGPGAVLQALASPRVATLLAILVFGTLGLGTTLWLVERRGNDDFHEGRDGFFDGVWWAMVTLTTVGYGDKVPRSALGRSISVAWMVFGVVFLSVFTASLASIITLEDIQGTIGDVDDLNDHAVVTVAGTTSEDHLLEAGIGHVAVEDIDVALAELAAQRHDAVVYDAPILQYWAAGPGQNIGHVVGPVFADEYYGIALPEDSPLVEAINLAIIDVYEDGTHAELVERWFGDER